LSAEPILPRLVPPPNLRPEHDLPLDGLRGLAALMVFYCHCVLGAPGAIDPKWSPPVFFGRLEAGQGAVLLFFVLSGYVIGLTNARPFGRPAALDYLRRRSLRIIPINLIAVLLAGLALENLNLRMLCGHVFFLQNNLLPGNFRIPVVATNPNLWSLHYEVVYYLLFLVIWFIRPPVTFFFTVLVVLSLALPAELRFISAWAAGLIFWGAGLWIAWRWPRQAPVERFNWPSLSLLALVIWKMQFLLTLLGRLGASYSWGQWVEFNYMDFLPACICLLGPLSGRKSRMLGLCRLFVLLWPALFFVWRLVRGTPVWNTAAGFYLGVYVVGVALWGWQPSVALFKKAAPFGAISYAFYAIASPIELLAGKCLPGFSGTVSTYLIRTIFLAAFLVATAWLLERRMQPWLKKLLIPARGNPA